MKKLTLALLASAALALPAAVPAMAQSTSHTMQPQAQQQQQPQQKQNQQKQSMARTNSPQPNQQQPNQQASNRISPQQLGRNGVRQVQQALNKDGFQAGHVDGIWGPDTRMALMHFQKSKDIQNNGQLNKKTLSDLGVNVASNQSFGNHSGNTMNSAPNQTMNNQNMKAAPSRKQ